MSKKPRAARKTPQSHLDVAPAREMLKPASETAIESAIEPAVYPMKAFEKTLPQPPMCRNRLMLFGTAQLNLPIRQRKHVLGTFKSDGVLVSLPKARLTPQSAL